MKRILIVCMAAGALLALVAAASGCGASASGSTASLSQETYDKVQVGATADALKAVAGEPARTETKSMSGSHSMGGMTMNGSMTVEYWYYQGSKGWVRFVIAEGKVTSKSGY